MQKGLVAAAAWKDRKVVMVLSTNTQPSAKGTVLRWLKDRTRASLPCPESIVTYNQSMGGVDRGDQVRGYYSCRTKSRKFYRYIFFFLFDVAITNAFILQKHFCSGSTHKSIKTFRLHLAQELIGEYCSRRRLGRTPSVVRPIPLRHFPLKLANDAAKFKRGRCAHCTTTLHRRTDSSWFCRECAVWLCHGGDPASDCFLLWHIQREET